MKERSASSVAMPPALRMMWASPVLRPRSSSTERRASMQARVANFFAGGMARLPLSNLEEYC